MESWPADLARQYTAAGYWRQRPLGACMWDWADRFGARTALVDGDQRISYLELARRADALAEGLAGQGLASGDNILVQLPNTWEFFAVLFACQRLGVAPVLTLLPHREHELTYLAELVQAAAIVVPDRWRGFDHQALAARVAARLDRTAKVFVTGTGVWPGHGSIRGLMAGDGDPEARRRRLDALAPDPGDAALFLLSGGTTGLPKIISRTHNDYEYNARCCGEVCGFSDETVYLAVLPVAHNFALASPGVLATLMAGGRAVLLPSPEPRAAFATIDRERVTVTSVVPAVAQRWAQAVRSEQRILPSLRVLQVGGSVFQPDLARQVAAAFGGRLQQAYGMAEGLLNYTRLDDPDEVILTTQGRPISPADEIRIVDESGAPVPAGQPGELLTRGPYTPRGYFAAPEHNAKAFTGGWYRTGDQVSLHSSGNLVVGGRFKDLINRGGEKISAAEVERLVRDLPQVSDIAAIPIPDSELGESVGICVVLRPGHRLTLEEVQNSFAASQVARFKTPQHLVLVPTLPKTPIGKVDKKELRKEALISLGLSAQVS